MQNDGRRRLALAPSLRTRRMLSRRRMATRRADDCIAIYFRDRGHRGRDTTRPFITSDRHRRYALAPKTERHSRAAGRRRLALAPPRWERCMPGRRQTPTKRRWWANGACGCGPLRQSKIPYYHQRRDPMTYCVGLNLPGDANSCITIAHRNNNRQSSDDTLLLPRVSFHEPGEQQTIF